MDARSAHVPDQRRRPGSTRKKGLRLRLANQIRLWDRTLDDLHPWEQEGPLRWRGGRLEGAIVDVEELHPTS